MFDLSRLVLPHAVLFDVATFHRPIEAKPGTWREPGLETRSGLGETDRITEERDGRRTIPGHRDRLGR